MMGESGMGIDLDESEIQLILDILSRTPVAGLETMRSVLLLAVKLEASLSPAPSLLEDVA
jgi:hypothetical protein